MRYTRSSGCTGPHWDLYSTLYQSEAAYAAQNPISTSFQEEGGWYHRLGQVERILVPRWEIHPLSEEK